MCYTNEEITEMFNTTFVDYLHIENDSNDMVFMKDINIFSHCEHHLALMYNMKVAVVYIPNGKVIALSKIERIADMAG
jgi:GTP cyclohydrolase I